MKRLTGLFSWSPKVVSNFPAYRLRSSTILQKLLNPAQNNISSSSAFSITSCQNNFSGENNLYHIKNSNAKLSTVKILDEPKRYGAFDLLKITVTCIAGLTVGVWMSKTLVAILEEYELYIHEGEDDDDYDDD